MDKRILLGGLFTCFAWASAVTPAAAISTYATRTSWELAAGSFETEDFETTPVQREGCAVSEFPCTTGFTFETPKLDIVIPPGSDMGHQIREATGGIPTVNGSREFHSDLHGRILVAGVSFNTIVFPDPITAFAVDLANVYDSNMYCQRPDPSNCDPMPFPITISVAGTDSLIAAHSMFFGATSDTPFSSVVMRITDPQRDGSFGWVVLPVLDNISFSAVPEPGTALLLGLGLLALCQRRATT